MQKTKINLIAGIFGILSGIGLFLVIIGAITTITYISNNPTTTTTTTAPTASGIGMLSIGYMLWTVGFIATFVCGILQLTKLEGHPNKGLMIAAGILNILGGTFFIGPIFSFICHFKQE